MEKLIENLNCGVCLEIMYKPISIFPCLHNFCGGCYSEWMKNNKDCPMCRKLVKNISKNAMCQSMVDDFLQSNPLKK